MPKLSCSAVKCIYNDNKLCGKGDIKVTGEHADQACDTCCSSFRENASGAAKNSVGDPSEHIEVDCSACNCRYNEDYECCAEKIDITGSNACQSCQTECCTFDKQW